MWEEYNVLFRTGGVIEKVYAENEKIAGSIACGWLRGLVLPLTDTFIEFQQLKGYQHMLDVYHDLV